MRVINLTESTLAIEGIYIPAGQHRNVRALDSGDLPERVQARLEAGDISIPDLDDTPESVGEFDQPEPSGASNRPFGGFFGGRDSEDDAEQ